MHIYHIATQTTPYMLIDSYYVIPSNTIHLKNNSFRTFLCPLLLEKIISWHKGVSKV